VHAFGDDWGSVRREEVLKKQPKKKKKKTKNCSGNKMQ
jgi:hypothetical protein